MNKFRSVSLKNFKCFRHCVIDLGDLTILAGLNGMGKSSLIQALLLIHQSISLLSGLKLNGDLVELGTGKDVLFDLADKDELSIGYEFEDRNGDRARRDRNYILDDNTGKLNPLDDNTSKLNPSAPSSEQHSDPFADFGLPIYEPERFQYLSAERLGPRKILFSSEDHAELNQTGVQGEYVLDLLSGSERILLDEDDPRLHANSDSPSLRTQIDAWLQEVSPGTRLNIENYNEISAHTARFSFERPGDAPSRPFRSTNVGFGISYVLPVLTTLLGARPGHLVIIENPEAHLHPRGQTRLGRLAAHTAKAGVQVVIETHSDHFLDGVRIAVKDGVCEPKDVAIHYFKRSGPEAEIISPKLQKDGRLSEWPEGFFDEKDDNLVKLLTPSPSK